MISSAKSDATKTGIFRLASFPFVRALRSCIVAQNTAPSEHIPRELRDEHNETKEEKLRVAKKRLGRLFQRLHFTWGGGLSPRLPRHYVAIDHYARGGKEGKGESVGRRATFLSKCICTCIRVRGSWIGMFARFATRAAALRPGLRVLRPFRSFWMSSPSANSESAKKQVQLSLNITDEESVAQLLQHREGAPRNVRS